RPSLGQRVLLLRGVRLLLSHLHLLLLLLLLLETHPTQAAEEDANSRPDGCTFARIPADGSSRRAEGGPAGRAAHHAALWRLRLTVGRRGGSRHGHPGIGRIESGLLHRPAIALPLVRLFLLRGLTPHRVVIRLGIARRRPDDETHEPHERRAPAASDHSLILHRRGAIVCGSGACRPSARVRRALSRRATRRMVAH